MMMKDTDELDLSEVKIDTLTGDIRDVMLMQFREKKRPWSMLQEDEQREMAELFERAAENLVRNVVQQISGFQWPSCAVGLPEIKIKGETIEGKLIAVNHDKARDVLGEHVGQRAVLVMVDPEIFFGEQGEAEIDPDQPDLPGADEQADA